MRRAGADDEFEALVGLPRLVVGLGHRHDMLLGEGLRRILGRRETEVTEVVVDLMRDDRSRNRSHAEHLELPRDTLLKKSLFACDELSGFVQAVGLVRPTGLEGLEPKSVKKKLKQPSFAAGVHRDEVYAGADALGLELDDHIRNVVAALQPVAEELGLRTAAEAAS